MCSSKNLSRPSFTKVMANLAARFKSGNNTPIERAHITAIEWEVLQEEIQDLILFQETKLLAEMADDEVSTESVFDSLYDAAGNIEA